MWIWIESCIELTIVIDWTLSHVCPFHAIIMQISTRHTTNCTKLLGILISTISSVQPLTCPTTPRAARQHIIGIVFAFSLHSPLWTVFICILAGIDEIVGELFRFRWHHCILGIIDAGLVCILARRDHRTWPMVIIMATGESRTWVMAMLCVDERSWNSVNDRGVIFSKILYEPRYVIKVP